MKKLPAILAAVMAVSCFGAFPAEARSYIDTDNLPTLMSSEKNDPAAAKFKKSKTKLTAEEAGYYYNYNGRNLSWKPVENALLYYVYAKPTGNRVYEKVGATYDTEYYVTMSRTTSYIVKAVTYTEEDERILSAASNEVTVRYKKPEPVLYEDDDIYCDEEVSYDEGEWIEEGGVEGKAAYDTAPAANSSYPVQLPADPDYNTEEYSHTEENGFKNSYTDPVSTFSADVDTASFANIRRLINDGDKIPEDAVRVEEMINYFDYEYPAPADGEVFSVYTELTECPWNKEAKLLHIGVQAAEPEELPASNLVFLVDVSGSMDSEDKLPLVKESILKLAKNMDEEDKISIVTYSGEERVLLAGANADCIKAFTDISSCMEASGCTNGESGINAAYEIAEKYYIKGGNNRIILCTDGDLNVGITDEDELTKLIEQKRKSGVYFTVLGFGKGNIKDNKMEALADNGNGSYHYIDSAAEASKVLAEERTETIFTMAKDVKLQTEFNPSRVKSYRLIGYDNRRLNNEDFENDKKDAGEVGAGQSVTVLYEMIPAEGSESSGLKYQQSSGSDEWCTVKIRYKKPEGKTSKLVTKAVDDSAYRLAPSAMTKRACAAAVFGMYLKDSEYKGTSTPQKAYNLTDDKAFKKLIKLYIKNNKK
ncbi:MAG: von Willebrand factor type A domain-containing protein [Oscillospiraceae bacterium]|nr:von Willebrand factor type A domain-containing protein [Oscillospiraceae bacterium]